MTEYLSSTRKSLTTTLGIAIAAALAPSGKIISSAVAGAVAVSVAGYAIHEHKAPPHQIHASIVAQGIPAYLADVGPLPLIYTDIESDGHEVHVLLATGADAKGSEGSAPSLWVSGGPIGAAGNPNQSFQRVGPTFGEPEPHSNAPDSPPEPQKPPVLPPEFVNPPIPPTPKLPCSKENKLLGLCKVDSKESASPADDKTGKDASKPSPHPNAEAAGPDDNIGGQHPRFTPDVDTETPPAQVHQQPNVKLLEKLLTEEFNDETPPGKTKPETSTEGGTEGNPGEQYAAAPASLQPLSISTLDLIPASVPEPSLISLMMLGVAAMAWTGRRRTAAPKQTRG